MATVSAAGAVTLASARSRFKTAHPSRIAENVSRFISEFDELSIINYTDLFTNEAATRMGEYSRRHGVCPR